MCSVIGVLDKLTQRRIKGEITSNRRYKGMVPDAGVFTVILT